ncbi:MAG: hypothetical protein GY859_28345 [Desulfobacterales bacterium]|nr:hypothetical protein [Desulfobacterales bacterium]
MLGAILDHFGYGEPKRLKIGDLEFEKVVSMRETGHREKKGSGDVWVCDGVRVVAWLYDNSQARDAQVWDDDKTKIEKLAEFNELSQADTIHEILHSALNAIDFRFGKFLSRDIEVQPGLIIVSMMLQQYASKQEKQAERSPPALATPGTDAADAATAKDSQGETEKKASNEFLRKIDDGLGTLFDHL